MINPHEFTDEVIEEGDEEGEVDEEDQPVEFSPIEEKVTTHEQTSPNNVKKKEKKKNNHYGVPYILEINRIILLDIRVRAQDFLQSKHSLIQNEIEIQIMSMFRRDLTIKGPPNSYRRGIYLDTVVWRIINHIVAALFATNKFTMLSILSTAAAAQSADLLTSGVSNTLQGAAKGVNMVLHGAVSGVGTVVTSGAHVASSVSRTTSNVASSVTRTTTNTFKKLFH